MTKPRWWEKDFDEKWAAEVNSPDGDASREIIKHSISTIEDRARKETLEEVEREVKQVGNQVISFGSASGGIMRASILGIIAKLKEKK